MYCRSTLTDCRTNLVRHIVPVDTKCLIYIITEGNHAHPDVVGTNGKRLDHTLHKLGQVVKAHRANTRRTVQQKYNFRRIVST